MIFPFVKTHRAAGVVLVLAFVSMAGAPPAAAVDIGPTDYVPAPAGTNALLLYYRHAESDSAHLTTTGKASDSHLVADTGILRYIHYTRAH